MKRKVLSVLCVVLGLIGMASSSLAQTTIMSDSFNNSSAPNNATGWKVLVDGATVTTTANGLTTNSYLSSSLANYQTVPRISWYPDYGGLVLTLGSQGSPQSGGTRRFVSPAYAVPAGTKRVAVKVSARLVNLAAEDVSIGLIEQDASGNQSWLAGGVNFSNPSDLTDFIRLTPATNWRTYSKFGEPKFSTTSVYVCVVVKNNANTTGVLYLDDASVVTSTDTSYLMESYSGTQGNTFSGTSGSLRVYLYDARSAQAVTFNVTDETGTALSPQPSVTLASGFYTVALPQRQYFSVNVSGTSSSGAFNGAFSAAVLNPAAPLAASKFGMFSVDTCNSQAYTAGSNWNRFFIDTQIIHQNTDGSFYSPGGLNAEGSPGVSELGFLPTNQKWEACLINVPQFMANVPAGQTYSTSKWYPPTDWNLFQSMVEYVVSNLPPSVQDFEVINEPEYNWGGNPATEDADLNMYFKTVHDAVADLRSQGLLQNPNLKIVGPSFAHFYSNASNYNDNMVTLQNALFAGGNFAGDTGLLTYVDEISMHGYNDSVGLQEPESQFYDRVYQWENYERNTAHAPGLTTDGTITGPLKPIHMTEYGWLVGTGPGQVSELTRAQYTSRAMIISRAMSFTGIGGGIPFASIESFSLRFVSRGVWSAWSLLNLDYTPAPTYVTYSTTAKTLGAMDQAGPYINSVPTQPTGGGSDYQCALFRNSNSGVSTTCLWSSSTTGAMLKMHMPFSVTFTAVDALGRVVTIPGGGAVTLSNMPILMQTSAAAFFVPTVTATITVAHSTTIPSFTFADALCPTTFTFQGATPSYTVKAPATPGTYNMMVKIGAVWYWYEIVVT